MQIAVYGSLNILSFWKILNGSVVYLRVKLYKNSNYLKWLEILYCTVL